MLISGCLINLVKAGKQVSMAIWNHLYKHVLLLCMVALIMLHWVTVSFCIIFIACTPWHLRCPHDTLLLQQHVRLNTFNCLGQRDLQQSCSRKVWTLPLKLSEQRVDTTGIGCRCGSRSSSEESEGNSWFSAYHNNSPKEKGENPWLRMSQVPF